MIAPAEPRVMAVEARPAPSSADRWMGLGLLVPVILYALHARKFTAGVLVDPVGPRAFPLMLAGLMAVAAIVLALRPTGVRTVWPSRPLWAKLGAVVVSLTAYAYLLEPLGYLLATTGIMVTLGRLFGAPPVRSVVAASGLVLILYFLFSHLLGLYLPALPGV